LAAQAGEVREVSPNELKILRLAHELKLVDKATIARKMGISTGYAQCLLNFLIRHDCLEPVSLPSKNAYVLTEEGWLCFLESLLQLRAQLQKKIDWLTEQRDKVNEKIAKLSAGKSGETEAAEVGVPGTDGGRSSVEVW
jgi:predicted transcriptional regulator